MLNLRLIIIAIVIIIIAALLLTQSSPPFLFVFPILFLTILISWYLHKEIQRDHEENLKKGIRYVQEEQTAQQWLHKSFLPRVRTLAKKNMRNIISASGSILMSFIFLWSYFVGGLVAAIINTIIGIFFFLSFIIYTLYAPKEFNSIFKRVPKRFRHHSSNDWVHGYILLLPFTILGFFFYSLTTIESNIVHALLSLPLFLFYYTLLFASVYCIWYLYNEYQKEHEKTIKKTAKKILDS